MADTRRPSLLAVYAHPDDEIFHSGVLMHLVERGVRVTLACATAGEAGKAHPSLGPIADLGAVRTEELRLSCRRLGIEEPVLLGFHDSARKERQRHDDPRALANVDMLEVEAAVRRVIDDVQPHVVLTFDPHGGYYHPDHVAMHRATTAAFFSSGAMRDRAPERLYYGVLARDVFVPFQERSRGRGIVDGLDPDVFSMTPELFAVSFDARAYVQRKFLAMTAHRSAFGVTEDMLRTPPPPVAAMLGAFTPVFEREAFVLGATRVAVPRWPLADLFDGIESAVFEETSAGAAVEESGAAASTRSSLRSSCRPPASAA